jgi:hypothetical protein
MAMMKHTRRRIRPSMVVPPSNRLLTFQKPRIRRKCKKPLFTTFSFGIRIQNFQKKFKGCSVRGRSSWRMTRDPAMAAGEETRPWQKSALFCSARGRNASESSSRCVLGAGDKIRECAWACGPNNHSSSPSISPNIPLRLETFSPMCRLCLLHPPSLSI